MTEPAYSRLRVDERRRQLLLAGQRAFTAHSYDEVSMAQIAREAGISKGLLYHYFPSKQAFFAATLQDAAEELARLAAGADSLPPAEQLAASLDAFLGWIEEHRTAYLKVMAGATRHPEVGELIDGVREATAARILEGMSAAPAPPVRTAVRAWLWFMDGACIDWLERGEISRQELHGLLVGTLLGALAAAGAEGALPRR